MTANRRDHFDIAVIGLGYIGLPTAAFFASTGLRVFGYDINADRVATIARGQVPFVEPGFDKLLKKVVEDQSLSVGTSLTSADVYIISVPTPLSPDKSVDPAYVFDAAQSIAPLLRGDELVILESTSPPGLAEEVADLLVSGRVDLTLIPDHANSIYVAHAPERVLPGRIMEEMTTNARIVGGINQTSSERAKKLYERFCRNDVLTTDARTAEMAKLTENAFRDVNIAFANELSLICDELNIDVWELINLANRHPRVNVLQPGPGVGGHCIAVDPWFIVHSAPDQARLIKTSRLVNDSKPDFVLSKIEATLTEIAANVPLPQIGIFGITFKPDIDDIRESPALQITQSFAKAHPKVLLYVAEPNLRELPPSLSALDNVQLVDLDKALNICHVLVILVDHKEFKDLDLSQHNPLAIIDTRGIVKRSGLNQHALSQVQWTEDPTPEK
ncbi:UDP-N-acetyl-D-mannosamine dehydrogenase [Corynebacterium sp. NML130628]|uniref:UDP-N-acetyl-D-mannosamine dehydrogenase n=1 Tax=Corynebacterium sp. NML130628 TaxID=1906333 RepID=UPI0008FB8182|nr:UDP-N-acetyl-D-mannosamine dehydrogenase [Corynebacterium sp. NML130628]OIR45765.1 UDP-N-acetyl-D-mannosamine dehydrogenase [Corynebacterium sp. NML130628]